METPTGSNVFLHVARLRLVPRTLTSNLPNIEVFSDQVTLKENVKGIYIEKKRT